MGETKRQQTGKLIRVSQSAVFRRKCDAF